MSTFEAAVLVTDADLLAEPSDPSRGPKRCFYCMRAKGERHRPSCHVTKWMWEMHRSFDTRKKYLLTIPED